MNAVEIEQAVSDLVEAPFDRESFAFAFLEAFGNKATTVKKLKIDRSKKASSNHSDLEGGVLQRNNIHLLVCDNDKVTESLKALVDSPETFKRKAKYALATDGKTIEAENLIEGETLACKFSELADHFGFFLPLAGITTVREIRNNAFDIKATSRLNRLYVELLRHNPEWDTSERREEMNHFFARLIFCFFAEDTGIFNGNNLFTKTVEQMSDGTNAHEILTELFRAMNTSTEARKTADLRPYASQFPYVNGGLFSGSPEAPKFTKIARSYLIHVGHLDWTQINPDIFGSMIQAVADDEERGALGMHYTSVPNILKVLNPLFLDDLRTKLEEAGDNKRKLLNLRNRMARIRVFDPACGSGNFLVIAYKEMREIEATINKLRGEEDRRSDIPLTNFRGIELRSFSAEIARLALIIAEYQCDVLYRGQKLALLEFLPLDAKNWITCGNALRLDWLKICPPTGTGVKITSDDLFSTPLDQTEMDFENEGGETFVCGNPPYAGTRNQNSEQKDDAKFVLSEFTSSWRTLDYVAGWLLKAASFLHAAKGACAFVTTNSICQGSQVPVLWGAMEDKSIDIQFAHTAFKWSNLAAHNAGVIVIIVGLSYRSASTRKIYSLNDSGDVEVARVNNINGYLAPADNIFVKKVSEPMFATASMERGNAPVDGGHLILEEPERRSFTAAHPSTRGLFRRAINGSDYVKGKNRSIIYVPDPSSLNEEQKTALQPISEKVSEFRRNSPKSATKKLADVPLQFGENRAPTQTAKILIPNLHSERRDYLTLGLLTGSEITLAPHFDMKLSGLHWLAVLCSRIHLVWIATVCGRMKTDYRYSNMLGWNTFPLPTLTEQNKNDLTHCAEEILLIRESYFPATFADLYDPASMPDNLRLAHERNDETLERIYIGRRFKNDTEQLEKLFEMYTKMTAKDSE